jgi:hypothetical protein
MNHESLFLSETTAKVLLLKIFLESLVAFGARILRDSELLEAPV